MSEPLEGPRAKLARAREHLQTLDTGMRQFLEKEPHPHATPHEFDPNSGHYLFRLQVLEPFPVGWSVLVGEFAYNLRSGLDQLVWQLFPKRQPTRSQFPIFQDKIDYLYLSRPMLKGIGADAEAAIKALQPYHRGNRSKYHPLAVLNDICNIDKHRFVHPTYATTADERPQLEIVFEDDSPIGAAEYVYKPNVALEDGAVVLRVILSPSGESEPNVKVEGEIPVDIAFGKRRLRSADLWQISCAVEEVIETKVGPLIPTS